MLHVTDRLQMLKQQPNSYMKDETIHLRNRQEDSQHISYEKTEQHQTKWFRFIPATNQLHM